MIARYSTSIFLLVADTAGTAYAQQPGNCANASTTVEINACLQRQFSEADAKLNEAYKEAVRVTGSIESFGKLNKDSLVGSLRSAQRAWLAFRDRDCQFQYNIIYPGTAAAATLLACKVRSTKARTAELNEWASEWGSRGY